MSEEPDMFQCSKCALWFEIFDMCFSTFHIKGEMPQTRIYCPNCIRNMVNHLNDWIMS